MRHCLVRSGGAGLFLSVAISLAGCTGGSPANGAHAGDASSPDAGGDSSKTDGAPADASQGGSDSASAGEAAVEAGVDAAPPDPCGSALFCETFDSYGGDSGVTSIADKQKFGPWLAALQMGATMDLDGTHTTSGPDALHVHIDNAVTAGGRLYAEGAQPIFATTPTHVYGRMMMYIDPNGTSIHWTFFGVDGMADPSSPAAGRSASYIMSSLPKNNVNTYSFVYGLSAMGTDGYHDCSSQSATSMPTAAWSCISFEMDSVARKLRMYKDGATTPILSVDDHGAACVAPTSTTSPWYGPAITDLFVGAWSFHPMNAPLDVWIDDLVVDTNPITCP